MARQAQGLYSWTDSPAVLRHIHRLISGDPDVGWLEYACRKYLLRDGKGVGRALSIGCGGGALERQVRQMGACELVDAIDLAPEAIEGARKQAAREGISGISYAVSNLDELRLPQAIYDVVFASSSVHHVRDLEGLFASVKASLKPDGILIMLEYVGPSQFQFTPRAVRIINDILKILPPAYTQRSSDPSASKTEFTVPSIEQMNRDDPSEAIRSQDILPLLNETFAIVEKKDYGGTIHHMLLQDIIHNFENGTVEGMAMLRLLLYLETLLIREKVLESDFCFVVASPKRGAWRDNVFAERLRRSARYLWRRRSRVAEASSR